MEQNVFYSALSNSLLTSVGQGFIIYMFCKILAGSAPNMSAEARFKFLYGAMVLIFAGFIYSLSRTYIAESSQIEVRAPALLIPSENTGQPGLAQILSQADYTKWIAAIYFMGILFQTMIILAGLYQLKLFRSKNKLWTDKVWEARLQILCNKLNIGKEVKLQLAERVFSPFTAGFIKPVIIFPIAMLNRLSPEQVEAILLHELGHIKRNDYLLNICHRIIEAILFFNPFIWLISREIRREREFACDDLVIEYTKDTKQYARALVHIAESKLKTSLLGIAASGNNRYSLLHRIKRLTSMKTQQNNPKSGLLAILGITVAFVSLACIIPTEATIPPADKKPVVSKHKAVQFQSRTKSDLPVMKRMHALPSLRKELKSLPPITADTDTNHVNEFFQSAEWKKQMEVMKSNVAELKKQFESPEWKKQFENMKMSSEEMKKHFESPEWKKQMQDIQTQSAEMKKHFESPEWKKQIEEMKNNAEHMKSQAFAMRKEFDSPEWKTKIEDMKRQSLEMKKQFDSPEWKKKIEEMKVSSEELKKQFESPEWKKKIEDMKMNSEQIRKQFDSPEWKQQMEEIRKMSEAIRQEAGNTRKKTQTPTN